jgi:hypothetical protein
MEHGGEEISGTEPPLSNRLARPEWGLHVRPDEASVSPPVRWHLEPLAEVESLIGNHHHVSGPMSPKLIEKLDRRVGIVTVPTPAEPLIPGGADRPTQSQDVTAPGRIVDPAVILPHIGLAGATCYRDPPGSVLSRDESHRGFLRQGCHEIRFRSKRVRLPETIERPAVFSRS